MKPIAYKIGEGERKGLSKDMQEIILSYQEENKRLEEENEKLKEENRKQKLHIQAKDKAYTALLKDYEELKLESKK